MPQDLYTKLAKGSDATPAQVKSVLDKLSEPTVKTLSNGENFKIPDYCIFKLQKREAREAQVKRIFGKTVTLAAREASASVKAMPVKKLKDRVKGKLK